MCGVLLVLGLCGCEEFVPAGQDGPWRGVLGRLWKLCDGLGCEEAGRSGEMAAFLDKQPRKFKMCKCGKGGLAPGLGV